jgi:hypothetical protein
MLRTAAVVAATTVIAAGVITPAQAGSNRGWPVAPTSFGIMYGEASTDDFSAVRAWEAATWCTIQPSPNSSIQASLAGSLGPQLDAHRAAGVTTAIVGLGHSPAWIFAKDPATSRPGGCSDHQPASVSIPTYASLKRGKGGALPVQAQRWSAYVGEVIDFLNARYGQSMNIQLSVWNEPNLRSGLSVTTKVPGSARSIRDAVNALYELERLTRDAIIARGNPAITLTSTALFQRPNSFAKLYLAKHGRNPMISSLTVNVYAWQAKKPDSMVREWNTKAASLRSRINKYAKLRRLPAAIGETNLNLVNNGRDKSNLSAAVTNPETQRRMATAVQMDAFYHGFSSVYWLAGPQVQAAVNVSSHPGTTARAALSVLRGQLLGSVIQGCSTKKGVRTCTFSAPSGQRFTVHWRLSGSSKLRLPRTSTVVQMTGESSSVGAGTILTVGTTPVVVRPA